MADDNKKKEMSLAAKSPQQLSVRDSLVKRGLQDISQHLIPDIDWSQPPIIIGVHSWYTELADSPVMRWLTLIGEEPENISNDERQRLRQMEREIELFQRSRVTGQLSSLGKHLMELDDLIIGISSPYDLGVGCSLELELAWDNSKSEEECVRELLNGPADLLAYDHKCGTLIQFSLHMLLSGRSGW